MKTESLTIHEAAAKYPEAKSHAFVINNRDIRIIYFRVENPVLMKPNAQNIRSRVKCLKLDTESGYLAKTNVPILNNDEIVPLTFKFFDDMVMAAKKELLKEPKSNSDLLKFYDLQGFIE